MNRSKSIEALLNNVHNSFYILKQNYQKSLNSKTVSEELKVDIKNIFENLRSCLDYIAHDIREANGTTCSSEKLYFPIRQSEKEFDQAIKNDFPNLQTTMPNIYNIVESVQPYHDKWLSKFNCLNNNNKHQNLEEQIRTETREAKVSSTTSGGSVTWGSGVTFGSGVSVMGVPIDPRTQMPVQNNRVKSEVTIWINFHFKENNESVLPFIEQSINKVEDIFKKIEINL